MKRTLSLTIGASMALMSLAVAKDKTNADSASPEKPKHGQCHAHDGHRGGKDGGPFRDLNLTDDQKAKIKSIMEGARPKIEAIRDEERAKMKLIMDDVKAQIRPLLTPEQQKVLDDKEALKKDRQANKKKSE